MTQQTKTYLKSKFESGDKPTQQDFTDMIDSSYNEDGVTSLPPQLGKVGRVLVSDGTSADWRTGLDVPYGHVVVDPNGNGDYLTIEEARSAGETKMFLTIGTHPVTSTIQFDKHEIEGPISIIGEDHARTIIDSTALSLTPDTVVFNIKDSDIPENSVQFTVSCSGGSNIIELQFDSPLRYNYLNFFAMESDIQNYYISIAPQGQAPSNRIKRIDLSQVPTEGPSAYTGTAYIELFDNYNFETKIAELIDISIIEPFEDCNFQSFSVTGENCDLFGVGIADELYYTSSFVNSSFSHITLYNGQLFYDVVGGYGNKFDNINIISNSGGLYVPFYSVVSNSNAGRLTFIAGCTFTNCTCRDISEYDQVLSQIFKAMLINCTFSFNFYPRIENLDGNTDGRFVNCFKLINCRDINGNLDENYFSRTFPLLPRFSAISQITPISNIYVGYFNAFPPSTPLMNSVYLLDNSEFTIDDITVVRSDSGYEQTRQIFNINTMYFGKKIKPIDFSTDGINDYVNLPENLLFRISDYPDDFITLYCDAGPNLATVPAKLDVNLPAQLIVSAGFGQLLMDSTKIVMYLIVVDGYDTIHGEDGFVNNFVTNYKFSVKVSLHKSLRNVLFLAD